jgi:uncharacterized membrane protein YoaT (DUF817 family)
MALCLWHNCTMYLSLCMNFYTSVFLQDIHWNLPSTAPAIFFP